MVDNLCAFANFNESNDVNKKFMMHLIILVTASYLLGVISTILFLLYLFK